jgi:tetratricopeptide (TPR) repeat protein
MDIILAGCKPSTDDLLIQADDLINQEEYARAIEVCNQILKRNDSLQFVYFNRGYCYQNLEKYKEALNDFNRWFNFEHEGYVLTLYPFFPKAPGKQIHVANINEVAFQRGLVKYFLDSLNSSFNDFQFCVERNYHVPDCYLWQGTIYIRKGNKEKGCAYYQKARGLFPGEADRLIKENCLNVQ